MYIELPNKVVFDYLSTTCASQEDIQKMMSYFFGMYQLYIKEGDWCIDIGANSGDSSLTMFGLCGKTGKVICFEPNKKACEFLTKNAAMTKSPESFDIWDVAVWNKNEKIKMLFSYINDNGTMLHSDANVSGIVKGKLMEVMCVDIYNFLIEKYTLEVLKSKLKFIKVDIEGYDAQILRFLKPLIDEIKPTIIIEWFKGKEKEIFETVKMLNYKALRSDNFEEANSTQPRCEDLILVSN